MKPSDLTRSAEEQRAVADTLAHTEQTDAVTTGLVDRMDAAERALKKASYQRASEEDHSPKRSPQGPKAVSKDLIEGAQAASANAQIQVRTHLKRSLESKVQDGVGRQATGKALEGSELEGADDLAYGTVGISRGILSIRHRLSGKDAAQKKKPLGELSEKGYEKPEDPRVSARSAQAGRYAKQAAYAGVCGEKAASGASAAEVAKDTTLTTATGGSGGFAAILSSSILPLLLGFLGILFALGLIAAIVSSGNQNRKVAGFGSLTGVQLEVAQALANEGLGRAQIAAIMGNIAGESGWNPTAEYHGEGNSYAYEYGFGLYQFTDTTPGAGEYSTFVAWCQANGLDIASPTAQTQFFIEHLRSSWLTGLHRSGYYTKYITEYAGMDASYDAWLATDDVGFATYCVMACWLRPADWAARQSFYRDRLPAAEAFYAELSTGGGGQEYAASNATQKAIVDACSRTPSPGVGWCAMWVSMVYENAGLGYIGGNACDMYANYCHSTDRSELKVGMLVAVRSSSSGTSAGATYGHVGIYIGDGKIMHNIGGIETWDLDDWINQYCKWSPVGWGFPPNVA